VGAWLVGLDGVVPGTVAEPDTEPDGVVGLDDNEGVGVVEVTVGVGDRVGFLVWVLVGVGLGVVVWAGTTTTSGGGGGRTIR
jgi:hypothetical protein